MATDFITIVNGLNLQPQDNIPPSVDGDIRYNSSTNNLEFYNGSIEVIATSSQLSNLTNANLSGAAAITNNNLAGMPNDTIKGNVSGITATPSDLTATQVTSILNIFSPSLQGLTPASGGGTTNFLRADGTWQPAGGGGGNATELQSVPISVTTPTSGQVLEYNGTAWTPTTLGGGSGTVTSVALADSTNIFNVTGSPITTSGTLTLSSLKNQSQAAVLIGPSSGGTGTPSFRLLLASDIPTLNQNTTGTASNITATSNSTITSLPSLTGYANTTLSNLTTTSVNQSLIPSTDATFSLGQSGKAWDQLYVDGNITSVGTLNISATSGGSINLDSTGFVGINSDNTITISSNTGTSQIQLQGVLVYNSTNQAPSGGGAVSPNPSIIFLDSSGTVVLGTPSISNGTTNGQQLQVINVTASTITINESATVKLPSGTNIVLTQYQAACFTWSSFLTAWICTSYSANA